MKYILQIFTGPWHAPNAEAEDIIKKIKEIASRIQVDQVIIGWNTDPALYSLVGNCLHSLGIRMLLWLPVFSEVGGIAEPDEAVDIFGKPVLPRIQQEGEDFKFGCPSSRRNLQIVKDIYEKHFSACGFDGVFLDKIRSQSFVAGVSGVLSCGCARCRQAFQKKGVDLEEVGNLYRSEKDSFFDMASYPMNGEFQLKAPLAQRFLRQKRRSSPKPWRKSANIFRAKA